MMRFVAVALGIGCALALSGAALSPVPHWVAREVGPRFALPLPPGWRRTAEVSCAEGPSAAGDDCFAVAYLRGPLGRWARIVVDPPGEPEGYDAVLPATIDTRGRIDPLRTVPSSVAGTRAVAVTATLRGHRYAVLYGGGPDAAVDAETLRTLVWGVGLQPR
jgi:hypothetical protein